MASSVYEQVATRINALSSLSWQKPALMNNTSVLLKFCSPIGILVAIDLIGKIGKIIYVPQALRSERFFLILHTYHYKV